MSHAMHSTAMMLISWCCRLLKMIGLFCKRALQKRPLPKRPIISRSLLIEATPYRDDALQKWGSHVTHHALHYRINISVVYGITWHIHGSPWFGVVRLYQNYSRNLLQCCSPNELMWLIRARTRDSCIALQHLAVVVPLYEWVDVTRLLRCNTQQCCSANELHCRVLQCSKWAVSHVAVPTIESCRVCWYVYTYIYIYICQYVSLPRVAVQ